MNPDVTIVVTVHNAAIFLRECMDSVCGQTYKNIEIICVDGGSTDNSPSILNEYSQKDERIKIINDTNTSYGHKVNIGIEEAKGQYIGILESDDMLKPDMVQHLFSIANQTNVDMVGGNIYQFFEYGGEKFGFEFSRYPANYYNRVIYKEKENWIFRHGGIYTKLYRREFLKEYAIKLNETPGASYQDQGFSFLTDVYAKSAYYINKSVYCYRIDNLESSIYDDNKIFENAIEMNYIQTQLIERKIQDEITWDEFLVTKYTIYVKQMLKFSPYAREQFKERFHNELITDVKNNMSIQRLFNSTYQDHLIGFLKDIEYFTSIPITAKQTRAYKYLKLIEATIGKHIVIFGAAGRGKFVFRLLSNSRKIIIDCLCDNSEQLRFCSIDEKKIVSVSEAIEKYPNAFYIVCSANNYKKMKEQLICSGICENNIYIYK